jgi:hypothetical protein
MKFSPDFTHQLLWFALAFIKVILISLGVGFIFFRATLVFQDGLKSKSRLKLWISLSMASFALYILLNGIK